MALYRTKPQEVVHVDAVASVIEGERVFIFRDITAKDNAEARSLPAAAFLQQYELVKRMVRKSSNTHPQPQKKVE